MALVDRRSDPVARTPGTALNSSWSVRQLKMMDDSSLGRAQRLAADKLMVRRALDLCRNDSAAPAPLRLTMTAESLEVID